MNIDAESLNARLRKTADEQKKKSNEVAQNLLRIDQQIKQKQLKIKQNEIKIQGIDAYAQRLFNSITLYDEHEVEYLHQINLQIKEEHDKLKRELTIVNTEIQQKESALYNMKRIIQENTPNSHPSQQITTPTQQHTSTGVETDKGQSSSKLEHHKHVDNIQIIHPRQGFLTALGYYLKGK